ncbi:hypothetical protein [Streptomyces sp. NPDC088733]|uniref:hypothetical protein n=1 Tax=Streptomyces sp. NPDC088733 TaxID=3365880 RepID=UPI003820C413
MAQVQQKSDRDSPPAALEGFYNIKKAAIRLGLNDGTDPKDESGHRWLRDGCNRPIDGSKGPQFPHRRMCGQLIFSDSDLAWITEEHRNPTAKPGRKPKTPAKAEENVSVKPSDPRPRPHRAPDRCP